MPTTTPPSLDAARDNFLRFVLSCRRGDVDYALTPAADSSAYARCFAVFCRKLVCDRFTDDERARLAEALRQSVRALRRAPGWQPDGKPYRQLLAFTLSSLAALSALDEDPLCDLIEEQVPQDLATALEQSGALRGVPGSGNQAMFLAVFLLHARDRLHLDTGPAIAAWQSLHLSRMNRFGFWGPDGGMTHLQFQNGYHQYEIFEYLRTPNPHETAAVAAVRSLADSRGHFAPYPGGGSCYDYDAVFVLTPEGDIPDPTTRALLARTASTISSEQLDDGGFAESLDIRPRTIATLGRFAKHVAAGGNVPAVVERLRYAVALQRPAHNRVHTHWSHYSRRWNESNLWDAWFRMLALARIDVATRPDRAPSWGFLDYPGIGYHPAVNAAARTR